jgi:hypothetical protein
MNRNDLINRYLIGKIKIEPSDYDFLYRFDTYKKFIEENIDKEIFYTDFGNDYHTCWALYVEGERPNHSEKIQNGTIKDMIDQITGTITEPTFNFGKYQRETIKSIIEKDLQYIDWCLLNKKGFVKFITDLMARGVFDETEMEILNQSVKKSYMKKIALNEKSINSYEKFILECKSENYELQNKIDKI